MGDSSVFRWVIADAKTAVASGKAVSAPFYAGGFKWSAEVEEKNGGVSFTLKCDDVNKSGFWECEADVEFKFHADDFTLGYESKILKFTESQNRDVFASGVHCRLLGHEYSIFNQNDEVKLEYRFNTIKWIGKFSASNSRSNVIVNIGDEKLHVAKEFLAVHSPVFEAMFFGDFAEKGKNEVEIKDVVYEEFVDLLNLIYPGAVKLTDHTVLHILKLADRFDMKGVMVQAEQYLMEKSGIKNKLFIADQFRLTALRDHCLNSFKTSQEMVKTLKSSPDAVNYSDELKVVLFDRLVKN